ncbi:AMP-binding enzyme domain-containing protein [Cardiosporidium cionae]|uniref:AMP-binding enzyme domain-containing protein n=1 Tax=Cardiosporidium cionae TaxID=476202 RepID=A0ABQ7J7C5_9APIC|nr:AMP-binding enzyme domain-containing protein [Cardiosporidium cionae]|eukprot:KAF8819894.1 AMP-binding enzyme domain-containing protein [Cardiosporidium cionae]
MSILQDARQFPGYGRIIDHAASVYPMPESTSLHLSYTQSYKNIAGRGNRGNESLSKMGEILPEVNPFKNFLWTVDPDVELPVRLEKSGPASVIPMTVVELFANTVCSYGNSGALFYKASLKTTNNSWIAITWKQYWDLVCRFGRALLALGLKPRERCVIMGCNAPSWLIGHFGTIFAGGIASAIYPTSAAGFSLFILSHSQARAIVVDTKINAKKILSIRDQLPYLKAIIMYEDVVSEELQASGVISFEQFLSMGQNVLDIQLSERMNNQQPGQCCSIIYTSGTTGVSKGVMLSHDNITWTTNLTAQYLPFDNDSSMVSYLPLSHIAAQISDIYVPLVKGGRIYFARSDALQGSLLETLKEVCFIIECLLCRLWNSLKSSLLIPCCVGVRPHWFVAVPRVWEKIEVALREIGNRRGGLRKKFSDWVKEIGLEGTQALLNDSVPSSTFRLVNRTLLKKIRAELGFDRCRGFGSCAAPLSKQTQQYFLSLGIVVCDIYGLSETTGPEVVSASAPGWFRLGAIGHAAAGTEVTIMNPDFDGKGEICFRGRNCFMGYFANETDTKNTIDPYGFLHTGDIGYIDADGFIFVTGRIKELLITAGGENISPIALENILKEELPFISNCQVIGDQQRFLSVLLCMKSVHDHYNQPTNNLAPETVELLRHAGSTHTLTTFDATQDKILMKIVRECLDKANNRFPSRAHHIRKWQILPHDFTEAGGELTPTLKLKRNIVIEKYKSLIDELYRNESNASQHLTSKL